MAVSLLFLLILLFLITTIGLGTVLTVASRKTRPLGLGLLGLLGVMVAAAGLLAVARVSSHQERAVGCADTFSVRCEDIAPTIELPAEPAAMAEPAAAAEETPEATVDQTVDSSDDDDAATSERKPSSGVRAVGEALLRGFTGLDADEPADREATATTDAAEEPEEAPAAEAAIEPTSTSVVIPPGRPDWIGSPPGLKGNVYEVAVASGPYKTLSECRQSLDEGIQRAVDRYVRWYLESKVPPGMIPLDSDDVLRDYADPNGFYQETIHSPTVGPVQQIHVLLKFDHRAEAEVDRRFQRAVGMGRLLGAGLLFGGLLAVLSMVFAYLKVDAATEHRMSIRLRFCTVMAILALAVVGLAVARHIPWM